MPYRKKYYPRKKKRTVYRRRKFYRRIPRMRTRGSVYYFKRYVDLGSVALASAATTSGGFSHQLDEVPGFAEFTSLFDLYRIAAVKVMMIPNITEQIQSPAATAMPVIRWVDVVDYNSSGSLASFNDAREFGTAKVHPISARYGYYKRYYKPRLLTAVEDDSSAIVVGGNRRGWLNTASVNIPHYGYRYFFEAMGTNQIVTVKFEAVYYMMFKQTK